MLKYFPIELKTDRDNVTFRCRKYPLLFFL